MTDSQVTALLKRYNNVKNQTMDIEGIDRAFAVEYGRCAADAMIRGDSLAEGMHAMSQASYEFQLAKAEGHRGDVSAAIVDAEQSWSDYQKALRLIPESDPNRPLILQWEQEIEHFEKALRG